MQGGEPPHVPVFVINVDGSGVDAYESLASASGNVEAIDVKNGEYAFFTLHGHRVAATVSGKFKQDVSLRATDEDKSSELQARLMSDLPKVGLEAALAHSPLLAAQALIDARWSVRWPRRPSWLDRRLNGERPVLSGLSGMTEQYTRLDLPQAGGRPIAASSELLREVLEPIVSMFVVDLYFDVTPPAELEPALAELRGLAAARSRRRPARLWPWGDSGIGLTCRQPSIEQTRAFSSIAPYSIQATAYDEANHEIYNHDTSSAVQVQLPSRLVPAAMAVLSRYGISPSVSEG